MALYNANLAGGGSSVTIDDVVYEGDLKLKSDVANIKIADLNYSHRYGSAVVLNDEIYIMGGIYQKSVFNKYYKTQKKWNTVSPALPYNFEAGCAVVLNGEIHILGSIQSGSYTKHYKWNGSSWISVSTIPYRFCYGSAVVLNGEIHILGTTYSYSQASHYKWNGSSWVSVSTLPYSFYQGSAVVLDGEIHIFGGGSSSDYYYYHYKWNGSSWVSVSSLPYSFISGSAVVVNGEIHILGTGSSTTDVTPNYYYGLYHYKFTESKWVKLNNLPYIFYQGCAVVLNNIIHIMSGIEYLNGEASNKLAYKIDVPIYETAS